MKKINELGRVKKTASGFELIEFKDRYQTPCSLQASSLAESRQPGISAVWIGVDDAQPKVMAQDAASMGVQTEQQNGWVVYPLPDKVMLSTRMHLDRKQVQALIGHLQRWIENGSFR